MDLGNINATPMIPLTPFPSGPSYISLCHFTQHRTHKHNKIGQVRSLSSSLFPHLHVLSFLLLTFPCFYSRHTHADNLTTILNALSKANALLVHPICKVMSNPHRYSLTLIREERLQIRRRTSSVGLYIGGEPERIVVAQVHSII